MTDISSTTFIEFTISVTFYTVCPLLLGSFQLFMFTQLLNCNFLFCEIS